mmetsp:Transcript_4618/g.8242  ORF Transcript_4618/g.8242 Transcript_4618/m.8242 type:complete len:85 (-) Transcript_4618:64-318(-)
MNIPREQSGPGDADIDVIRRDQRHAARPGWIGHLQAIDFDTEIWPERWAGLSGDGYGAPGGGGDSVARDLGNPLCRDQQNSAEA